MGGYNEVLQQEHYYPFGMGIRGEWKFVQPQIRGGNMYQYNGIELNDDFGLDWNMAFYRSYDPSMAKWTGVDPEAEMYYSWNSYNMALGNPITNSDPSGATVVDPNGNPVSISFDEDNKPVYTFSDKYSEKKRARVEKRFMKETAPIISIMAETEQGRKDIETLNNMSTSVELFFREDATTEVNSWVYYGKIEENGYYKDATIAPYFGNHKESSSESDFAEWLGAVMTVEVGHLEKDQIKLDTEAKKSNPRYLQQPNSKEFQKSYEPLLNRATEYRIKYRKANNQPITKEVFAPLDKYGIKYNEYNKVAREGLK